MAVKVLKTILEIDLRSFLDILHEEDYNLYCRAADTVSAYCAKRRNMVTADPEWTTGTENRMFLHLIPISDEEVKE